MPLTFLSADLSAWLFLRCGFAPSPVPFGARWLREAVDVLALDDRFAREERAGYADFVVIVVAVDRRDSPVLVDAPHDRDMHAFRSAAAVACCGERGARRGRRPRPGEAVLDGSGHDLFRIRHGRVAARAVVAAGGFVIFWEGATRRGGALVFAQDPRGREDRVRWVVDRQRMAGVGVDGVGFPQRRPGAWAAFAAAHVGDLHWSRATGFVGAGALAVAALLRPDRREEAPVDVEPLPGSLV